MPSWTNGRVYPIATTDATRRTHDVIHVRFVLDVRTELTLAPVLAQGGPMRTLVEGQVEDRCVDVDACNKLQLHPRVLVLKATWG
jgi:hypothetical protein